MDHPQLGAVDHMKNTARLPATGPAEPTDVATLGNKVGPDDIKLPRLGASRKSDDHNVQGNQKKTCLIACVFTALTTVVALAGIMYGNQETSIYLCSKFEHNLWCVK